MRTTSASRREPQPEIYLPGYGLHAVLLVRTSVTLGEYCARIVRSAVRDLDSNVAIYNVQTVDEVLTPISMARQKMTAVLLGIFCRGCGGAGGYREFMACWLIPSSSGRGEIGVRIGKWARDGP